jgi:hypothetical protein
MGRRRGNCTDAIRLCKWFHTAPYPMRLL